MILRFVFAMVLLHLSFLLKAQSNIDVLHYKFEIELSDRSDTLKGRAVITLQFTGATNKFLYPGYMLLLSFSCVALLYFIKSIQLFKATLLCISISSYQTTPE